MREDKERELPYIRGMVLAAGHGTRLGGLSKILPKPLLPVCGVPLIRYSLAHMGEAGLCDVVVNLHHLGDKIKTELGDCGGDFEGFIQKEKLKGENRNIVETFGDLENPYVGQGGNGPYGLNLYYSEEKGEILGTGGGIKKVKDFFGGSTFVVFNGKIVCTLDIARAVAFHRNMGALATMVLRPEPDPYSWGAVETDGDGWIQTIAGVSRPEFYGGEGEEKVASEETSGQASGEATGRISGKTDSKGDAGTSGNGNGNRNNNGDGNGNNNGNPEDDRVWSNARTPVKGYVFTGIHIIEPEFLDILPNGPSCIVRDGYFEHLKKGAPLAGFIHEGYWQDHSTLARYVQGNMRVLDWKSGLFENTGFPTLNGVQEGAEISDTATIVEPVLIGKGARIEAGARVGPGAVIGCGATVSAGKVVSNSVVWDNVKVTTDAVSAVATPEGIVPVDLSDMGAKYGPRLRR